MDVKSLYHRILFQIQGASFSVRYWDGELVPYGPPPAAFLLHLKDAAACTSLLGNLELRFGEAYMAGAVDVHGDWREFARTIFLLDARAFSLGWADWVRLWLMRRGQRNSLPQARRNVARHYDLGNDFFKLWLGKDLVYTCAYFRSPQDDIDTAQAQKMELICRKLRLRPGERLLDVGCGWGGFLAYAAARHGVRGLGITLSAQQRLVAAERVAAAGLAGRVSVERMDYRELPAGERFDKVASIGMFEHVGRANIPDYFRRTARWLREGGIGLLHTIGSASGTPPNPWLGKYIFPGCYFPSLPDVITPLCAAGLCVTDLEDLGPHYALTLDRWAAAFEERVPEVTAMYGEPFVRMWRLYLNSCAAAFRHGGYHLWHVQFTKGAGAGLPLTRDYLRL
jgi:cyclopropane-fatty-acyl-phospholipid synthase